MSYGFGRRIGKNVAKAKVSPSLLDIAWAAGIVEGEGHFESNLENSTYRVIVTQVDQWLLRRLLLLFGGVIHAHTGNTSRWCVSGARARGFALTILSFLSPRRREQALNMVHKRESRRVNYFPLSPKEG